MGTDGDRRATDEAEWLAYAPRVAAAVADFAPGPGQSWPPYRGRQARPVHVCSAACSWFEERPPPHQRLSVLICRTSGHLHLCSADLCAHTREVHGGSGDATDTHLVCDLTAAVYAWHPLLSSDDEAEDAGEPRALDTDAAATGGETAAPAPGGGGGGRDRSPSSEPVAPTPPAAAAGTMTVPPAAAPPPLPPSRRAVPRAAPPAEGRAVMRVGEGRRRVMRGTQRREAEAGRHRRQLCVDMAQRVLAASGRPATSEELARLWALSESLWTLLRSSSRFATEAPRLRSDLLTLVLLYLCQTGFHYTVSTGQTVTLLRPWPEVAERLLPLRRNAHFSVSRHTSAHKAFQRCLNGVPEDDICAFRCA
jgi:hypothetical protein